MSNVNTKEIMREVDNGMISAQRHPTLPLTIYNYTPKAQFARHWTPETLMCRGLILSDDGEIVARPFPKFFNLGEHEGPLPDEPYRVYEKMDGSLFIVAMSKEGWIVSATRGSFVSSQADVGRELFEAHRLSHPIRFKPNHTYCFEVIYPENRIVVDYGSRRDLVFLAAIDNTTGRTIDVEMPGFDRARRVEVDFHNPPQLPNSEGFVVHFHGESDLRIKVKLDEYVRLHRLLTGVTARTIWELRSTGQPLDDLISVVPDEFYRWVSETDRGLQDRYREILNQCQSDMNDCPRDDRKSAALYIKQCAHPHVLFSMLDGKQPDPVIWKMLRPAHERPFRQDVA